MSGGSGAVTAVPLSTIVRECTVANRMHTALKHDLKEDTKSLLVQYSDHGREVLRFVYHGTKADISPQELATLMNITMNVKGDRVVVPDFAQVCFARLPYSSTRSPGPTHLEIDLHADLDHSSALFRVDVAPCKLPT